MDYEEDSAAQTAADKEIIKFYKSLNKLQSSAVSYILKNPRNHNSEGMTVSTLSNVVAILDKAADDIGREGGCPPPTVFDPDTGGCE